MKKVVLGISILIMCGCADFLSTTANRGIAYGMSPKAVVKVNQQKGYKILSQDENNVVVEGMQEQLKQPAVKTFYFENGRLVSVSEKIK